MPAAPGVHHLANRVPAHWLTACNRFLRFLTSPGSNRHAVTLYMLCTWGLLTSLMIGKKKPLDQIHPKRWEMSTFSIATDDSVSRQLQNLIGDARKKCCSEGQYLLLHYGLYFHTKHLWSAAPLVGEEDSFSRHSKNTKAILIGDIFWLLDNIPGIKTVTLPPQFWHLMSLIFVSNRVIVKLIKIGYGDNSHVYYPIKKIYLFTLNRRYLF